MRIAFFGTPDFAVPVLKAVHEAGHEIVLVVTQPDKPSGRKQEVLPTPVKKLALELGLTVVQPERVRDPLFLSGYRTNSIDLNLVVAFGQIMPDELIYHPLRHSINIHASLLPKYRGAAPINAAIVNGETETGVTYQFIECKLDCGDIIYSEKTTIDDADDAVTLYARLSSMAAGSVNRVLEMLESGKYTRLKQNDAEATYIKTMKKEDGRIDFKVTSRELFNKIRGLVPWPAAFCGFNGSTLKILRSEMCDCPETKALPGTIIETAKGKGFKVGTADGCLLITEVQPEGKKKMSAWDFTLGHKDITGKVLE
jgi:methionyl-tRNA formyltransferase